ncbi:hypothetical protein [Granulicella arctica]|uniref:hypothetical protein n=1 Tax=Granulicella arctica TaxID=940613 RepID=UPI0021E00E1D|nr:hypothetical protein [Granulicella arctica]
MDLLSNSGRIVYSVSALVAFFAAAGLALIWLWLSVFMEPGNATPMFCLRFFIPLSVLALGALLPLFFLRSHDTLPQWSPIVTSLIMLALFGFAMVQYIRSGPNERLSMAGLHLPTWTMFLVPLVFNALHLILSVSRLLQLRTVR